MSPLRWWQCAICIVWKLAQAIRHTFGKCLLPASTVLCNLPILLLQVRQLHWSAESFSRAWRLSSLHKCKEKINSYKCFARQMSFRGTQFRLILKFKDNCLCSHGQCLMLSRISKVNVTCSFSCLRRIQISLLCCLFLCYWFEISVAAKVTSPPHTVDISPFPIMCLY